MMVYIESLGCARNQVDSETMAGQLRLDGWTLTRDPAEAEVIVVNTCSFVEAAINESIDTVLELARFKTDGRCQRLIVAGCLPERFREAIADALPEVDQFLGTGAYTQIGDAVTGRLDGNVCLPDPDRIPMGASALREREQTTSAYLKIAEGCSRHCTYCIIPRLRGRQKSRPMAQILEEARQLIDAGAREINLVAQDTTHYGHDRSEPARFADLLAKLAALAGDTWIRFLYGHPESIDDAVLQVVAAHDNLCPYFDLPVQHASKTVLKKMGRGYDKDRLLELFRRIRTTVPGAVLRTTLIVGFPGESDADFKTLMDFVAAVRFDHLGVFTYSDAEDLPSHRLSGHVSKKVAQARHDAIMARQMAISADNLTAMIGRTLPVLVEAVAEPGLYEGRSILQAPEVDGLTYVRTPPDGPALPIGEIVRVQISETLEYDLIGRVR
ncbi:30S ribosomal protein S12 methylthiotransferase RimO [Desulfosarcina ovata]|uniref:Ribosomal protein uS12 methylthiotransferase RimO n=1 Tax=Desulfosarcina ovata subsp. ovata TaxID=2752305 RepID=A0A5K8ABS2_9BACT|nr:30S ribosomal protein S12 methylthiotransferase RimO [Desulfosarcina ovata]BBO89981.1 ribosomal protein S12 methylthiotransferase RimO [Desulfosarcina ovata subsp. ovata]